MPYKESHYPYFEPLEFKPLEPTDILWRYMSIDKFMGMLYEKTLYFSNIFSFNDKKEGTLSDKSREEVFKTNLLNEENTPVTTNDAFQRNKAFIDDFLEFHTELETKDVINALHSFETLLKLFSNHLMFCNSWFLKNNESHSMWAEYGDKANPTSIAIQTTVEDLINSIKSTNYHIHIGKIKYKDYENDSIEGYEKFPSIDLNDPETVLKLFYAPIMHKRDVYSDENEIRAVISFESVCQYYLDKTYTTDIPFYSDQLTRNNISLGKYETNIMENIPQGIPVKIDLSKLIQNVVMSPNTKRYFHKPLQKLMIDNNLNPNLVRRSKI